MPKPQKKTKFSLFKLCISLLAPFSAASIGSFFTFSAIPTWYQALRKPTFTPPNSIFGPVWTILYILMGISLYLVWQSKNKKSKLSSYYLFFIQLILNSLWSIIFFGLHALFSAVICIIALWIFLFLTILFFYRFSKQASLLLIPYICWVSYASLLTFFVYLLNR